jgi:hypothetical protein
VKFVKNDDCLELLLKRERPRSLSYIYQNKEFDYIRLVNKVYFRSLFTEDSLFDFALDAYMYWKDNNVLNSKHEALLTTLKMMYTEAEKHE